jgi:hypothetical protein
MTEPEYKVKCRAFRWGALKGTPTARLRRALGEAEPVWGAMRRFAPVASQTVCVATLTQTPSVLANATSKEIKLKEFICGYMFFLP